MKFIFLLGRLGALNLTLKVDMGPTWPKEIDGPKEIPINEYFPIIDKILSFNNHI